MNNVVGKPPSRHKKFQKTDIPGTKEDFFDNIAERPTPCGSQWNISRSLVEGQGPAASETRIKVFPLSYLVN